MVKSNLKPWQKVLHEIIYEADTPAGKYFDVALLIFILASVASVMIESVKGLPDQFYSVLRTIEWVITILFTIEYILRIICLQNPRHYILSFYGIIDFISTIPLYLSLVLSGSSALVTVRALRLLRVFRILKITRYIGEARRLRSALQHSKPKILIFLFAVLIVSIITGTLMYLIEGDNSGFTSIPRGIYWAIVTLTTVGFGDIAPTTPLGQFIASILMILGYGIIAVPTGIVSAEYAKHELADVPSNTQSCAHCGHHQHQDNAKFCLNCGSALNAPES
ncbi:MAG: ion transporter [Flavobacteriaceae bacterium]|mgnify:FL=1|jgi:voltage-gated potassium channel|nr:ion transporter [Flavobacteriaceae bacterium]MDG1961850.1 ion transporter [Flavobacteriaceae bacterium]